MKVLKIALWVGFGAAFSIQTVALGYALLNKTLPYDQLWVQGIVLLSAVIVLGVFIWSWIKRSRNRFKRH